MKTGKGKQRIAKRKHWSVLALLWAVFVTVVLFYSVMEKPKLIIVNHMIVVDSGIMVAALIVGSAFWWLVEAITPPAKGTADIFLRVVPAFIAGLFIGGFAAVVFDFGQYLVFPVYYRNPFAAFELFAIVLFTVVTLWHAAWLHMHSMKYTRTARKSMAGIAAVPASSSALTSSGVASQIWNLIWGFIQNMVNSISSAMGGVIGSFGSGIGTIITGWARAAAGYGLWGFLMAVISLGISFIIGGLMLTIIDFTKDVTQVETEI